jgi:hypothetical protein
MRLVRSDIGGWVLKCNPRRTDIEAALRGEDPVDAWCVQESYRLRLIEPGDPAMLWISGARGARPTPGIWLVGHATGEIVDDEGSDYWAGRDGGSRTRAHAGLRLTTLGAALPREALVADPRTADMEVLRQPQMSNPSYLTRRQQVAVEELLGGWPAWT